VFALGMVGIGLPAGGESPSPALYVLGFVMYVVLAFVAIYGNAAVIGVAMKRLDGQDATIGDGIALANAHLRQIFLWSLVTATVVLAFGSWKLSGSLGALQHRVRAMVQAADSVALAPGGSDTRGGHGNDLLLTAAAAQVVKTSGARFGSFVLQSVNTGEEIEVKLNLDTGEVDAAGYARLRHIMRVAHCRTRNNKLTNFIRYASQTLNDPGSAVDIQELLRLACREMGLKYLEIGLDDESEILAGYYGAAASRDQVGPGPGEMIRVNAAEGDFLVIRYQLSHLPGQLHPTDIDATETAKLERQDIQASLARLFSGLSIEQLTDCALNRRDGGGKMAVIEDMSQFINKPASSPTQVKTGAIK
jgi:hypothetical protein